MQVRQRRHQETARGRSAGIFRPAAAVPGSVVGIIVVLFLVMHGGIWAHAATRPVRVDFSGPWMDLRPALSLLRTERRKVAVTVPGSGPGELARLVLEARGRSLPHYWLLFAIDPGAKEGERPRLIAEFDRPRISGSGLSLPLTRPVVILSATARGGEIRNTPWRNALALAPLGRGIANFALEVDHPAVRTARLWKLEAFQAEQTKRIFASGMLVGISILVMLGLLALHVLRPLPSLPAAALLAAGMTGFVTVNTGILEPLLNWLGSPAALWRLAAFFEGLCLAGIVAWVFTWLELPRRGRLLSWILWSAAAASGLLAVWGLVDPASATPLLRPALFAIVPAAYVLVVTAWRRHGIGSESGLVTWSLLAVWSVMMMLAVSGVMDFRGAGILLSATATLTLLSLGATMARAAFSPAAGLRNFLTGATRRALALAAAGQAVWDMDLVARKLEVGGELERQLGLGSATLSGNVLQAFEERIHPSDLPAYRSAVEAASHKGAGRFSVQFRLRRGDGTYRWFLLQGRPLRDTPESDAPTRLVGVLMDVTAIRRSEERLLSDAVRDRVTGLPNRPLLLDRLSRSMQGGGEDGGNFHLVVIDVDRFRNINEAWGFEIGDVLLGQMARRMKEVTEPVDTVARLQGDRFALLIDTKSRPRDMDAFLKRLGAALSRPYDLGVREVSLTVCMGVTHVRDGRGLEAEDVLKQAEIALFEARGTGAGSVAFFRDEMLGNRSRLVMLEQDLRRAVERGEIEVLYQPIMRVGDHALAGFEALVRWRHPVHGLMGPDSFVPLAEEIGLIGEISRVVLEEATRNLGIWQRAFRPDVPLFVAVNISSKQLLNASLVDEVSALIEREGIAPSTLKLELTESLILENPELGRKIVERLAGLGVQIACDDFGTGYSSLATLRDLHFHTLKIDRSFLAGDDNDSRSAIILGNVVTLAHDLGMDVVAEGVETEEQLARLTALGCDMAQGWLIGQPVSARRVIEALAGISLEVTSPVSRFRKFRERLFGGAKDAKKEDADFVLPVPPLPPRHSAPSSAARGDGDEEPGGSRGAERDREVDGDSGTGEDVGKASAPQAEGAGAAGDEGKAAAEDVPSGPERSEIVEASEKPGETEEEMRVSAEDGARSSAGDDRSGAAAETRVAGRAEGKGKAVPASGEKTEGTEKDGS